MWQVKGKLELDDGYVTRLHEETQRRREQAEQQSRMREVSVCGRSVSPQHCTQHTARLVRCSTVSADPSAAAAWPAASLQEEEPFARRDDRC